MHKTRDGVCTVYGDTVYVSSHSGVIAAKVYGKNTGYDIGGHAIPVKDSWSSRNKAMEH